MCLCVTVQLCPPGSIKFSDSDSITVTADYCIYFEKFCCKLEMVKIYCNCKLREIVVPAYNSLIYIDNIDLNKPTL